MMQKPHTFSGPTGIQNEAISYIYSEQTGITPECKCSSPAKRGAGGGSSVSLAFLAWLFSSSVIRGCLAVPAGADPGCGYPSPWSRVRGCRASGPHSGPQMSEAREIQETTSRKNLDAFM